MTEERGNIGGTAWNRTLLATIPDRYILQLAQQENVATNISRRDLIFRLSLMETKSIVRFIKDRYLESVEERRQCVISDTELEGELQTVAVLNWHGVQGSLRSKWGIADREIQDRYVRKFPRLSRMHQAINDDLRKNPYLAEIRDQSTASWYNHWSTILIENHIGTHRNVVPTLSPIKGLDIFFQGLPFDLKVSSFPKRLSFRQYAGNHRNLATWLYEHQSHTRFGAHNRIYLVLADRTDLSLSWRLKSKITLISSHLDEFFDQAEVSSRDRITFRFRSRTFKPVTKVVLISSE